MLESQPQANWPHIFIVGAPRSGTSLVYEVVVTAFKLAYFTNLSHRFYMTPLAVTKLGQVFLRPRKPAFQSDYGHIAGWAAPNEGGWIWRRWFEDGAWTDESALSSLPAQEIKATLSGMSNLFHAPFINKNVMHSNRIRLLDALFPGCLFIEVRRDPKETVRSIVRAQRRQKGPEPDREQWWSVRPSIAGGVTDIERACRQVVGVAHDIDLDCSHIGANRLIRINYETMCEDPRGALEDIRAFFGQHAVPAIWFAQDLIPRQFMINPSKPLPDQEEALIDEFLDNSKCGAEVPWRTSK